MPTLATRPNVVTPPSIALNENTPRRTQLSAVLRPEGAIVITELIPQPVSSNINPAAPAVVATSHRIANRSRPFSRKCSNFRNCNSLHAGSQHSMSSGKGKSWCNTNYWFRRHRYNTSGSCSSCKTIRYSSCYGRYGSIRTTGRNTNSSGQQGLPVVGR